MPVLRQESQRAMTGGAGNVARNIAALGGKVVLVGLVGDDARGPRALGHARRRARNVPARLIVDPDRATTVKTRFIAGRQQLLRVDGETAKPATGAAAAAAAGGARGRAGRASISCCSPTMPRACWATRYCSAPLRMIHGAGKRLIVDPKSRDSEALCRGRSPDPQSRRAGRGHGHCRRRRRRVCRRGARRRSKAAGVGAVLATRGERGMTLVEPGDAPPLHLAAEAREVFDVSGAGDTVIAAAGERSGRRRRSGPGRAARQYRGRHRRRQARHRRRPSRRPAGRDCRPATVLASEAKVVALETRAGAHPALARGGRAHRLHQWLLRSDPSRPCLAAGPGAGCRRPADRRPQQRCLDPAPQGPRPAGAERDGARHRAGVLGAWSIWCLSSTRTRPSS